MSAPDRKEMLDRADKTLSIRRQCALIGVARSGVYRARKPANDNDLSLMRRIDELFTSWPLPGSIDYIAKGLWWSAHALLRRLKGWNDWSHGHGFDGWLSTERFDLKRVFTDPDLRKIIFNTLTIVVRLKIGSMINRAITRFDPNDLRNSENSPEGLALTPLSTADGKRNGPREYVVKTERERPDRLQVRKNTLVTKIIFDGKRAVGVEAREGDYLYGASPMPKTEVFNVSAYETIGRVEGGRISGSL
jgi:GMC oxidoreductase